MLLAAGVTLVKYLLALIIQLLPSYLKLLIIALYVFRIDITRPLYYDLMRTVMPTNKEADAALCRNLQCCRIYNKATDCSLRDVSIGEEMIIMPGGTTRCIFSFLGSYSFQVKRGDKDKLLVYLAGGGACLNQRSTANAACKLSINSPAGTIREKSFDSYTIVKIHYCSGDMHIGNVTRLYTDPLGEPVQQRGLVNTQAVLDWIVRQQQDSKALDAQLSSLLLMGTSAGALGVQFWSRNILDQLNWDHAAVVVDSFLGITEDVQFTNQMLLSLRVCFHHNLFSSRLQKKCILHNNDYSERIQIEDILMSQASAYPMVPFAFIQSKVDINQLRHYDQDHTLIGIYKYYAAMNKVIERYTKEVSNFIIYLIDGTHHGFLQDEMYYHTNAYGPTGSAELNGMEYERLEHSLHSHEGMKQQLPQSHHHYPQQQQQQQQQYLDLHEWVAQLPLQQGQSIQSICEGTIIEELPSPLTEEQHSFGSLDEDYFSFCLTSIRKKQYLQP